MFYTKNELQIFQNASQWKSLQEIQCAIWSAKESLVKYLKTGFTVPLELLEVAAVTCLNGPLVVSFKNFPVFSATLFTMNEPFISLCSLKSINFSIERLWSFFRENYEQPFDK